MKPRTLFDKIWDYHLINTQEDGASLIYIDRHLVHEVTSPQAFEGLRLSGRVVKSPNRTLAVADHNVPTTDRAGGIEEEESRIQVEALDNNVAEFGIPYFNMMDARQGIVHVIGPEQGFTQPGMTIVCGDSHTATHGAFGALAFGIGTSEVEHVLATQTLIQKPAKNMLINVEGELQTGVSSKDLVLAIIGEIGTAGGTGHVIEYSGDAIKKLSMEARMTVCNMSIEAGARAGMIAPDEITFEYLSGRPMSPKGKEWDLAVKWWKSLPSDENAFYDKKVTINASEIKPTIVEHTEEVVENTAPNPSKSTLRDQIMGKAPLTQKPNLNYTSNGTLNDLLNETAMGNTNTQMENTPASLSQPFATGAPLPENAAGLPPEVANAVTRDYSGLMKAINKKKGN